MENNIRVVKTRQSMKQNIHTTAELTTLIATRTTTMPPPLLLWRVITNIYLQTWLALQDTKLILAELLLERPHRLSPITGSRPDIVPHLGRSLHPVASTT
jgi:hypothetical protein